MWVPQSRAVFCSTQLSSTPFPPLNVLLPTAFVRISLIVLLLACPMYFLGILLVECHDIRGEEMRWLESCQHVCFGQHRPFARCAWKETELTRIPPESDPQNRSPKWRLTFLLSYVDVDQETQLRSRSRSRKERSQP